MQTRSTAFLLAQVGAHAASRFAARLSEMDLAPPHAGILRAIARNPGLSQQALASLLGMLPSRLVAYIDELEERRLLERHDNPQDRRLHSLQLTDRGSKAMTDLGRIAREHDDAICASLGEHEREQLWSLLGRIADDQGLTPGVHPGFAGVAANPGAARKAAAASDPEPKRRRRR